MCRVCFFCFGFERFVDKFFDGNLNLFIIVIDLRVGRDGFVFFLLLEAKFFGISVKFGRSLMDFRDFFFGVLEGFFLNIFRFFFFLVVSFLVLLDILGIGFNDFFVIFLFLVGRLFNVFVFLILGFGIFLMFLSLFFVFMEVFVFRFEFGECFLVILIVRLWLLSFIFLLEFILLFVGLCGLLGIIDFFFFLIVFFMLFVFIIFFVFLGDFGCCSGEVIRFI